MNATIQRSIFDKELPLPDKQLTEQAATLLAFTQRYKRISQQLRLLMHLGDLARWSKDRHGKVLCICRFVAVQHPLVIFHGDVGTGKTVTAESIANQLVLDDERADDSLLFKLSTRVRGTGKVGEMGTLINEAFHTVTMSAGEKRRAFLIIDEGDSLAAKRSQEQSHHEDKVAVNTLIQNIDELKRFHGRILVILCTNWLSVLDPAIIRRAAIVEGFMRPSAEERLALFQHDLGDLDLSDSALRKLVEATGPNGKPGVPWTYSDIRTRLYPAALAKAFPHDRMTLEHLLVTAKELNPSPLMEVA